MKDFFKLQDFRKGIFADNMFTSDAEIDFLVRLANEKLAKLIESWPVVMGWQEPEYKSWIMDSRPSNDATHTARLAFIQPIEPCKHEPFNDSVVPNHYHCKHCGVELKAKWEAVK